jgi:hypothetical protein
VHPVEVAASIGVIGSATVAVVAYVSTAAATRRTLDAERERRNRDERSAAYTLVLRELLSRQSVRLKAQRGGADLELMAAYFAMLESQEWIESQVALLGCAPQAVIDALEASQLVYIVVAQHYDRLQTLRRTGGMATHAEEIDATFMKMLDAVAEADKKDQALANAIRADIGAKPVQIPLPSWPAIS